MKYVLFAIGLLFFILGIISSGWGLVCGLFAGAAFASTVSAHVIQGREKLID